MPLQTAVSRRNRTFIFRLRVPAPLVPVIHRKFLKRSLRTADPVQARLRGARLLRGARELFRRLERLQAMLRKDEIEELVRSFYAVMFEESRLGRYKDNPGIDELEAHLKAHFDDKGYLPARLDDLTDKLELGLWQDADQSLEKFKQLFGVNVAAGSRDERLLREYLMRALRQLMADELAVLNHRYEGNVIDPLFQRPLPDPADARLRAQRGGNDGGQSARPTAAQIAGSSTSSATSGPIAGSGDAAAQEVFRDAVAIASADGRNMVMPAEPDLRIPLVPEVGDGKLSAKALRTIPELFHEFLDRKEKAERSAKTLDDYKRSLAAFVEIVGIKPVALYRVWDVEDFVNVLQKVPARARVILGKSSPYRAAAELNDAAAPGERRDRMKAGTINHKYLTNVFNFFEWARTRGMMLGNPAARMQIEAPRGAPKRPRRPFTVDELRAIFAAPVFRGCKSAKQFNERGEFHLRDHRFWAPLLALYSGCRLNELGQLQRAHLAHDAAAGRWWLRITTRPDPEDVEDAELLLKSAAAERLVPLHPILIALGFPDYVRRLPESTGRRIFPDWKQGSDEYYSSPYSKWFNERFLGDQLGIKKPDIVFHSLRHCFKDALRRARVSTAIQNRLLGHADDHVGENYGTATLLPEEAAVIDEVSYPGLDLSGLLPFDTVASVFVDSRGSVPR